MRKIPVILVLVLSAFMLYEASAFAEAKGGEAKGRNEKINYFVEGIKFRGEGKCEEAINSYKMARKLRQFKDDWAYHLAVADCYVALKKYDEAVDAYTRVIDGTKNKPLQAEMYKGRGRAYYLKAVKADTLDKKYLDLARKDLNDAKELGADTDEIEKSMAADLALKTVVAKAMTDIQPAGPQTVAVIEGPNKIIAGDGEYVLFLSGDTALRDRAGQSIPVSEIRPGDSIDFSCASSYINRADGMTHCSAKTITLSRNALARPAADAGKPKDDADAAAYLRLINQRLDKMDKDIRDLKERSNQPAKAPKSAVKAKAKKRKAVKKTVDQKAAAPAAGAGVEKALPKKPSDW